jgi:hypothetical protein
MGGDTGYGPAEGDSGKVQACQMHHVLLQAGEARHIYAVRGAGWGTSTSHLTPRRCMASTQVCGQHAGEHLATDVPLPMGYWRSAA